MAASESNRELEQLIGPPALIQELNPLQVYDLFRNVPQSDIPLLGMTATHANPADLLVTRIFVPPVCIRPSVVSEVKAGTTEDDLTMKQSEILLINDVIAKHMSSGGKMELIQEDWDFLQLHVALYFNSELSGVPLAMVVSTDMDCINKCTQSHVQTNLLTVAQKTIAWYCSTAERQTRSVPRQFVWQTCRLFRAHCYFARSESNDSPGRRSRSRRQNPHLPRKSESRQSPEDEATRAQRHRKASGCQLRPAERQRL